MKFRQWILTISLCIVCMVSGCTGTADYILQNEDSSAVSDDETEGDAVSASEDSSGEGAGETVEEQKGIFVYICGAVANPGVYEVDPDSRVYQVIELAGGFTDDASRTSVNLADLVEDSEMICIPTTEEAGDTATAVTVPGQDTGQSTSSDGKVNLNTASLDELMTLSGIGETKASRIIAYREENGSFQNIEDIMQVEGIGESTYDNIKDSITVQ